MLATSIELFRSALTGLKELLNTFKEQLKELMPAFEFLRNLIMYRFPMQSWFWFKKAALLLKAFKKDQIFIILSVLCRSLFSA